MELWKKNYVPRRHDLLRGTHAHHGLGREEMLLHQYGGNEKVTANHQLPGVDPRLALDSQELERQLVEEASELEEL